MKDFEVAFGMHRAEVVEMGNGLADGSGHNCHFWQVTLSQAGTAIPADRIKFTGMMAVHPVLSFVSPL